MVCLLTVFLSFVTHSPKDLGLLNNCFFGRWGFDCSCVRCSRELNDAPPHGSGLAQGYLRIKVRLRVCRFDGRIKLSAWYMVLQ